jgi:hypothetical protein
LFLRLFRTARPPAELLRFRKPCFLALFLFFGWYVLLDIALFIINTRREIVKLHAFCVFHKKLTACCAFLDLTWWFCSLR